MINSNDIGWPFQVSCIIIPHAVNCVKLHISTIGMNNRPWWHSSIGWDGILPFTVALLPLIVKHAFPRGHIAEVVVLIVPLLAALVRTHFGWARLIRLFESNVPWTRQVALAMAIVLLLVFEVGTTIATLVGNDFPKELWCYPIVSYVAYFVTICWTMRPPHAPSKPISMTEPTISN